MSIKSKGRTIGRMIRVLTGLPLPIAQKVGKRIAQGKYSDELAKLFPEVVKFHMRTCGDPQCCTIPTHVIKGPKMELEIEYEVTEAKLAKELEAQAFFRVHPGGVFSSSRR